MAVNPLLLATLPEGRRRTRRLGTSTFFSIEGQEETERKGPGGAPVEPRKHSVSIVTAGNVDLLA
jgi:hypothetical protein